MLWHCLKHPGNADPIMSAALLLHWVAFWPKLSHTMHGKVVHISECHGKTCHCMFCYGDLMICVTLP